MRAKERVQLKDIHQREIHRLELAGLTLNHHPLLLWSARVVIGEDLQRLAMFGHQTLPDASNVLADLLGGHDPARIVTALGYGHGRSPAGWMP
jgi:hypothetical protein